MEFENRFEIKKWLEVRTTIGYKYIPVKQIIFIKAENKTSTIFFDDLSSIKTNHLIKWYQEKLDDHIFIRCHNSYIVNCLNIEFFCGSTIITRGNFRIPISRNYKLQFKNKYDFFYKNDNI